MHGASDHHRCQHRHSGGPRRRGGPRPVVEECGPRALRRQGRWTADLPLLRGRHGSARQGAAKPGARAASGDQRPQPRDLLSAGGQYRGRQGLILRGAVVAAALAACGLPASRLELEITEAVLIRDDEAALDMLHQLRKLGVRIALDDFGTGYSSLSYLQRFPFDKIKIDRSFIRDIAGPGASSSIVQAVVNIAAASDITTTAEGVETEHQRNLLYILGCTEMQGFLFSPAIPTLEIRRLLLTHRGKVVSAA